MSSNLMQNARNPATAGSCLCMKNAWQTMYGSDISYENSNY